MAGFKKAYPDLSKTDFIDPFILADRLRFGRLPTRFSLAERYFPLQRLTRFRYHLMQAIAWEKSYFLTFLFLKFSEYHNAKPFSDTFGATSGAMITDFCTVDEIVSTPIEDLIAILIREGKNRFPDPEAVAQTLKRAVKDSYRLDKCLVEQYHPRQHFREHPHS